VEQLRDVVTLSPGEADNEIVQAPDPIRSQGLDGGFMALGFSCSIPTPDVWDPTYTHVPLHLDHGIASELCKIYLRQVDPIVKILHRPSLTRWLIDGGDYLGYPERHPATDALGAAVSYLTVMSMTEDQCTVMLNMSKATIATSCRKACESALERSGLLTTQDTTVLQAFVLYLVGTSTNPP
jgi:hypothetical protein